MNTPLKVLATILLTFESSLFAANERSNVVWLFAEDITSWMGTSGHARSFKRESVQTRIQWNDKARRLILEPQAGQGTDRTFKVELLPSGKTREIRYTGKSLKLFLN